MHGTTPLDRESHSGFLCLQHDSDERLSIVWLESMTTGLPQRDILPRVQLIFILVSSPGEQVNLLNEVPARTRGECHVWTRGVRLKMGLLM